MKQLWYWWWWWWEMRMLLVVGCCWSFLFFVCLFVCFCSLFFWWFFFSFFFFLGSSHIYIVFSWLEPSAEGDGGDFLKRALERGIREFFCYKKWSLCRVWAILCLWSEMYLNDDDGELFISKDSIDLYNIYIYILIWCEFLLLLLLFLLLEKKKRN